MIKPQYRSVSNFNDDLCAVENHEKKWGFINKEGEVVINYQFDDAKDFENGKCVVQLSEKKGLINDEGKFIINPQFSEMKIDGDMCLIIKGGKWGWTNSEGKIIIEPQFDHADPFKTNNITSVRLNDKYGYIDRNGKIIIDFQFDVALPFFNEIAPVINSNKFGFIGKDGLYVINPVLEDIPDDLISYLLKGRSLYSEINTDYLKFKEDILEQNENNFCTRDKFKPLFHVKNKLIENGINENKITEDREYKNICRVKFSFPKNKNNSISFYEDGIISLMTTFDQPKYEKYNKSYTKSIQYTGKFDVNSSGNVNIISFWQSSFTNDTGEKIKNQKNLSDSIKSIKEIIDIFNKPF